MFGCPNLSNIKKIWQIPSWDIPEIHNNHSLPLTPHSHSKRRGGGKGRTKISRHNLPEKWARMTWANPVSQDTGVRPYQLTGILDLGVILQWLNQQDRILFTQNHIYPTCLVYPCFWYPSFLFVLIDRNAQETQPVWCNFPSNVKRGGTIPFPWGLPNQPSLWNWTLSYNLKLSESDISKAPLVINMII